MKIKYILAAASVALMMPAQAMAHHDRYEHDNSDIVAPLILGAAIIGGSIILNRDRSYHHDHYHHHNRRHRGGRRGRVIDTYRRGGHTYRVCRRGDQVFYC